MLRKTPLFFECFPYVCPEPVLVKPPPYVCPEPVLVKDLFLNVKMAQKVAVVRTSDRLVPREHTTRLAVAEMHPFNRRIGKLSSALTLVGRGVERSRDPALNRPEFERLSRVDTVVAKVPAPSNI
jgi:hypothetical protein